MPDPCACGAREPHADSAGCLDRLLRDREALVDVLDRLTEVKRLLVARVEIDAPRDRALVLYVTTSQATRDADVAALVVSQFHAAEEFGAHRGAKRLVGPLRDVHARFKHLDPLLSDPGAEGDDPMHQTCRALWAAVKLAVETPR